MNSPLSSNLYKNTKHHYSGETIANWIASQFDYINKLQRIVMDTTSENTGKYNGIAAILEKLRQCFNQNFKRIVIQSLLNLVVITLLNCVSVNFVHIFYSLLKV
jgi:hypothetical protein